MRMSDWSSGVCPSDLYIHWPIVRDDRDRGFKVDAMFFADGDDVAARIEEAVAAALIHQRVGPETRRHFSATRLAYQRDMIDVGRAVRPLIGTRQRRMAACRIEGLRFGIEAAEVHGVADRKSTRLNSS